MVTDCKQASEGKSYGKVEGKVAAKARMQNRIVLARSGMGWVHGLHAEVEAQDKVVEIQSETKSVGHSQFAEETMEAELPALLVGIIAQGPDVSGINEGCTVEFPEEERAVFEVQVDFHVARLVDEVDASAGAPEATRPQFAHAPATHRVGTTREIAFLERQNRTVAIGIGNAEISMGHELVVLVEGPEARVVEVELGVLRVRYIK